MTEISIQLEKLGHKGRCLFIDGSPTFVKSVICKQFSMTNDLSSNVIESRLLIMILSLFVTENISNILVSSLILDPFNREKFELGLITMK